MFERIFKDLEESFKLEVSCGQDSGKIAHYGSSEYPSVNVYRESEALCLVAELPGVHPENIEVSVKGRNLTITGKHERSAEAAENEKIDQSKVVRQEFSESDFKRTLRLLVLINSEKVEAKLENGILRVELPIAEESKPRKIEVK